MFFPFLMMSHGISPSAFMNHNPYTLNGHRIKQETRSIPESTTVEFYSNGKGMILTDIKTKKKYLYSMSTPWDINTARERI